MKTRRIVDTPDGKKVVWFGSYGANPDGTSKLVNANDKHDNFSEGNQMIHDNLVQKLSILKHELWYNYAYGMPLIDKAAKVMIDAFVMQTIQNETGVLEIKTFESSVNKHNYTCNVKFATTFGDILLSL